MMDFLILSKLLMKQVLTDAIAAAPVATGPLNGAKVLLFQNPIIVDDATLFADLVEATFDGYARSAAVTYTGPGLDPTGEEVVYVSEEFFTCSGVVTPNTVYGAALIDPSPGTEKVWGAINFAPITPLDGTIIPIALKLKF